jgi:CDGSH-type Zn-finger protein
MSEPVCAQKAPYALELEAGDYYWCQSKKQPFCDGSHKGSDFAPKKFTVEQKEKVWLCGCKQSKNAPHCDGAHKDLK